MSLYFPKNDFFILLHVVHLLKIILREIDILKLGICVSDRTNLYPPEGFEPTDIQKFFTRNFQKKFLKILKTNILLNTITVEKYALVTAPGNASKKKFTKIRYTGIIGLFFNGRGHQLLQKKKFHILCCHLMMSCSQNRKLFLEKGKKTY